MNQSQQIHDMIQTFDMGASPELIASRLLDIMQVMNERMDAIEIANAKTASEQTNDERRND